MTVAIQYAASDALDEGYCPWLRGKPRPTSSVGAGAMTAMTSGGGGGGGKG